MKDNELIEKFWVQQGGKPHWPPDIVFYESNWNMLMPVVEKIAEMHSNSFNYDPELIAKGIFPEDNDYLDVITLPVSTKIEIVYKAVVGFIKWYQIEYKINSQSK
jgi:hypothetical protein